MGDKSHIEWTDATWSPVTGCTRVSEGCRNCYAERMSATRLVHNSRYKGVAKMTANGPHWTGKIRLHHDLLRQPLGWGPRRVFVNSMSDTFHKEVPFDFIKTIYTSMLLYNWHQYQVLTKRPERMREFHDWLISWAQVRPDYFERHFKHVVFMTSAEDQKTLDERLPHLLATRAAIRGLSLEPLLGPIDLTKDYGGPHPSEPNTWCHAGLMGGVAKIDWVIVGGESGPGARPMNPRWVRDIRDQCKASGVAFFFKQWGEWAPGHFIDKIYWYHDAEGKEINFNGYGSDPDPYRIHLWPLEKGRDFPAEKLSLRVGKKAAGRLLDGQIYSEYPK